jgi:hypothetical protein
MRQRGQRFVRRRELRKITTQSIKESGILLFLLLTNELNPASCLS